MRPEPEESGEAERLPGGSDETGTSLVGPDWAVATLAIILEGLSLVSFYSCLMGTVILVPDNDDHNIKVWLDWGMATDSLLNMFREVKVWHIQTTTSDHCALVVECLEHSLNRRMRKRNFRYENMWQRDPSYMALIQDSWTLQFGAGSLANVQTVL
jgi:hypothetical protein